MSHTMNNCARVLLGFLVVYSGFTIAGVAPEALETNSNSELYVSDAAYFDAKGPQTVIFVPGFIFNKESWYRIAKPLQKRGVASLALSGNTVEHVRAGIQQLRDRGFNKITLVGGSSGAASVLNIMNEDVEGVNKIVTLSAVRGNPVMSTDVEKLFVVSKEEKSYSKVNAFYEGSSQPKTLKVFDGSKHAQFLFFSQHKDAVSDLIMTFILQK